MAAKSATSRFTEIRNSRALREYHIEQRFEAGLVLRGTEVKSVRLGRAQINEAYGRVKGGELWLFNAHIDEYAFGSYLNHETRRDRKLLLHKAELRKILRAIEVEGRVVIPLRLYFKEALVKVELGLGVGKKLHDKRQDLRDKVVKREIDRAMKQRR
jgi:SsrA-binding protein